MSRCDASLPGPLANVDSYYSFNEMRRHVNKAVLPCYLLPESPIKVAPNHNHDAAPQFQLLIPLAIVDIGLSDRFVPTGLRVMVKQPDSREIPGFFLAIFSAVTQFDVCPVGWYNRRIEFLGKTGALEQTAKAFLVTAATIPSWLRRLSATALFLQTHTA